MTRPQRLGILPTVPFWRGIMRGRLTPLSGLGALAVCGSAFGVVRLFLAALPGWTGPLALAAGWAVAYLVVTLELGALERVLRGRIRARRAHTARRARALGEEELARSLEAGDP